MPRLTTSISIDRPVSCVFAILRDVPRYPDHFRYISSVSVIGRTDTTLTAEILEEIHGLKQRVHAFFEFTRPHHVRVEQISGPFRSADAEFILEPAGNGTHLRHSIEFEVKGGFLGGIVQRAVATSVVETRMREETAAIKRAAEQCNHE